VFEEPGSLGTDENGRRIVNIPQDLAPDELTPAKARELVAAPVITDRVLGIDPESGFEVLFKDGRYGPYVVLNDPDAAKPKTASLFKTMDAATIDLDQALQLLSLPRVVGKDDEGLEVTAQNGPYGPYIKRVRDTRQLTEEAEIFTIDLAGALAKFAEPKYGARRSASAPLREFGEDPASGGNVVVKTGQFGAYVTDGFVNATIPKEETIEELSADKAYELLMARREKLGLEPGVAPAKASKGRGSAKTTKRVVKAKGKK